MRLLPMFAAASLLAGCAHAGGGPSMHGAGASAGVALPALGAVTRVVLLDARSGASLGAVVRADSVAALVAFYQRIRGGWRDGAATEPEVVARFYRGETIVGMFSLAWGAFGARAGDRALRRTATGDEALTFARLAGLRLPERASKMEIRP